MLPVGSPTGSPAPIAAAIGSSIRVAYFAGSSIEGFVTVDGDRQAVRFLRGLNPLFLVHHGTATAVTFESAVGHVCVGDVRVGKLMASTSG